MQLVAMGAQDVFLTGNPQITFFKVVYRRHTNFSKECIVQEFNGSVPSTGDTSSDVTCTLARNGDLVQEIYVKAKINANDTGVTANVTVPGTTSTSSANQIKIADTTSISVGDKVSFNKTIIIRSFVDDGHGAATLDDEFEIEASPRQYFIKAKTAGAIELEEDVFDANTGTMIRGDVTFGATEGNTAVIDKSIMVVPAGTTVKTESVDADNDISNLVNTVELEIGGQKIDKHYAAWFDIYNELFETKHDYRRMLTRGAPGNDEIVYIPLRFWFNRNAGLALPLIALQYHEVKVVVNLKVPANCTLKEANLLVNYVYLDTDERRRFAQVSHEYLIEQVQHTGVETINSGANATGRVDMNFNHPVKALFWITDGSNYLDKVKIQLNGHDRFSEQEADYFHLVQPYECGLGNGHSIDTTTRLWGSLKMCSATNSVGMYSFCLKPGEHQPSGSCNFSRIDNARLNYINGKAASDSLHLFALNYNVLRIMSGMGGLTYSN